MNYSEREQRCRELVELIRKENIFNYHELVDRTLEMNDPMYFKIVWEDSGMFKRYIESFKRVTEEKERNPQSISPEDCFLDN